MAADLTKLGSSLEVPSVQELIKTLSTTVPGRYVRDDVDDHPINAEMVSDLPEVPIIDMQKFISENAMSSDELDKLDFACTNWGFFQLINHGVNPSLIDRVKMEVERFFDLPLEEKKKFGQLAGDIEGFGQAFVQSNDQKLDWADMFYMLTLPAHLRKPHLLPMLPPSLRETLEEYSKELKDLAMKILHLMGKALGMKAEEIEVLFEEGMQAMRLNYYPPCPHPELVVGISAHADATGLTILLQLDQTNGLQIKRDGVWIPVVPLPNAFIVNAGDILEIVTNGAYRSIEHRVMTNSNKERVSVAVFLSPKLDGDFGPAPSLITPRSPAQFIRISATEYLRQYFLRKLDGKTYINDMRITREENQSST